MKNLELRISGRIRKFSILNSQFSIIFAVCVSLWFIPSTKGELSFKFQPGDKYFLLLVSGQKTTQVFDGNEQVFEQTVRLGCDLDIEEVDENDCAWSRYTYRKCALNIKHPDINIQFDSDANETRIPVEALPLYLVIGETLFLKITPQGRIISVNGLPALLSSAKARVPFSAIRNQVVEAIDRNFDETLIRRSMEEQLAVFPPAKEPNDGNLIPGFSWSRVEDVNEEPKQIQLWLYQFKERRGSTAFIDVNIAISPGTDLSEVVISGIKARREVSGKGSGTIEIDEATGRIINEKLVRQTVDEIKASPEGPVLRLPPLRQPITTNVVNTFQMTKRE